MGGYKNAGWNLQRQEEGRGQGRHGKTWWDSRCPGTALRQCEPQEVSEHSSAQRKLRVLLARLPTHPCTQQPWPFPRLLHLRFPCLPPVGFPRQLNPLTHRR